MLHYAAFDGEEFVVEMLLRITGIKVNAPGNNLNTPLHPAVQAGHSAVVRQRPDIQVNALNGAGYAPQISPRRRRGYSGHVGCAWGNTLKGGVVLNTDPVSTLQGVVHVDSRRRFNGALTGRDVTHLRPSEHADVVVRDGNQRHCNNDNIIVHWIAAATQRVADDLLKSSLEPRTANAA